MDSINVNCADLENLMRFGYIWTERGPVQRTTNSMYPFGDFHIEIDPNISIDEANGLLSLIPWGTLCLDGTVSISYLDIISLIKKSEISLEINEPISYLVLRIMCLGDYSKYWKLINPNSLMSRSSLAMRMMLADHGGVSIVLK